MLDIIIGLILLIGMVRGFIKGFIFEIAVIGALFLGYFLGFRFAGSIAPKLAGVLHMSPIVLHYIAVFLIWIAVSIGVFFLAKLFTKLIDLAMLGVFNKIAGAFFGGLKYALILSIALYLFNKIDSRFHWIAADKKAESIFYYKILGIVKWMGFF